MPHKPRIPPRSALALALLVLVSYAVSLGGGFVWDDRPLIVENGLVQDPSRALEIVSKSFWETDDRHDRFRAFFRPVVGLTYALDHAIWGDAPRGYRLTNLLLHFLCCLLVYRIARQEGLGDSGAFVAGALFAVHPVHVENVAWISGRTDLTCGLFLLAAFTVYRGGAERSSVRRNGCSALLFLLALFCKEMAITLPLLILLHATLLRGVGAVSRTMFKTLVPFAAATVVYFFARMWVLGGGGEPLFILEPLSWIASAWYVFARYTMLLLLPLGLDAHYPDGPVESLLSMRAALGLAFVVVLGWVVFYCRRISPRVTFWLLWIIVSQAPVYAFGWFGDVLLADRFLYIPSAGLAMLLGLAMHGTADLSLPRLQRSVWVLVAVVLVLFAVQTGLRSRVWRTDRELFENMLLTSPNSALVRSNLGLAWFRDGRYVDATAQFERAVQLSPSFALAHNNLAASYETLGRHQDAYRHYERALELSPKLLEARSNGGHLAYVLGRRRQGLRRLRELVEDAPRYVKGRYALADVLARGGSTDEALELLEQIVAIDPDFPQGHYLRGKLFYERGEGAKAAVAMTEFLRVAPADGPHVEAAHRIIEENRQTSP